MESVGLALAVVQTYNAVVSAYDLYLSIKEFPSAYRELRIGFMIEKYRLTQWGEQMLSEVEQKDITHSEHNAALWKLFQVVVEAMWTTFQDNTRILEEYGKAAGFSQAEGISDLDMLQNLSISAESTPKRSLAGLAKSLKFILRDRKKLEQLVKNLCYWNDSLEKMSSELVQDSLRRRLRTKFSTGNLDQLHQLEAVAAVLRHRDLQRMAGARAVVEQSYLKEKLDLSPVESPTQAPTAPNYQLEMQQLDFQGLAFMTDQTRAMAMWKGESVVVDWRLCRDDTWRRQNPNAFRLRTENLTKILNSDLAPLGLSVLHCVGYLDQSSKVTGYAFQLPPEAPPGQKPVTLHQLLANVRQPSDIPGLGERFDLAKALVSTVFEIHNLGWLHKNLSPKQIVFFRKGSDPEPDLSKPWLMGFDISRPNLPGEVSEKPLSDPEDDAYRHPHYKSANPRSFRPPFDIFSLGVILFEIGLWRSVGALPHRRSAARADRGEPQPHSSDTQFIEQVVMNGPILELKRYMGTRYRDAVSACLSKFDAVWDENDSDPETQLQKHQMEFQRQVVDAIAVCRA